MQMQAVAAACFFNPVKRAVREGVKGMSEHAKRVQIGRSNAGAWRRVSAPLPSSPPFHSLGRPVGSPVFRGCVCLHPSSARTIKKGLSCLIPDPTRPTRPTRARQADDAGFFFYSIQLHACISCFSASVMRIFWVCWCFGGWLEIRVECPEMACDAVCTG
jgi:hypothetical protein